MHRAIGLAFLSTLALAGCGQARGENGGPPVSRNYAVGTFERIEVGGPYEVEVRTGVAPGVAATGPQEMIDRMVVEVKDGTLHIRPNSRNGFNMNWGDRQVVRVQVGAQQLRAAELAGSGDIRIDRVSGDEFAGGVAGSGGLSLGQVEVGKLTFSIGGSGGIKAGQGRAGSQTLNIAGSGDIDASGIASDTAAVSVAGSGNVTAQARRTASVSIMGSGDVEVTGGAKCTVSKMGSGEARCS